MGDPRSCSYSRLSGSGDSFRGSLIVASNREPYSHRKTGCGLQLEMSAGGLVSALDAVLKVTGGTWVAWGSGNGDHEGTDDYGRLWVPPDNPAYTLKRVSLSADAVNNYYRGFCNLVLWPLFHGETSRIRYSSRFWPYYEATNRLFAEAILQEATTASLLWIHDYHLCLVPALLRAKDPERSIAHFWHIPWPEPELFVSAPHGREIMVGLLGNDLIGFQIPAHARNFLASAQACLGASVDHDAMTVRWEGRLVQVAAFPVSIDFSMFDRLAASPATASRTLRLRAEYHLPELVGLAVDRLDYIKGITQRLEALDLLFQRHPSCRGRFSLVQIAVMTRFDEPYLNYQNHMHGMIEEINSRHGTDEWRPVLCLQDKLAQEELAVWYRLADLALVTPIRDGMNLVAKEFVASRHDCTGTLILGRNAGAAAELTDSLLVDPNDVEGYAEAIHRALVMPAEEKRKRMAQLRAQVSSHTVFHWVGDILEELAILPMAKRGGKHALRFAQEISSRLSVSELLICLDFDGTLAPIEVQPETVTLQECMRSLLRAIQKRHPVAIISGRSLMDLKSRVNLPGLLYFGNHGAEIEDDVSCAGGRHVLDEFLRASKETLTSFSGVQIEDKGVTVSIHFRRVAPVYLAMFQSTFRKMAQEFASTLDISEGRKVFEIRPVGARDKGDAVTRLMTGIGKGRIPVYVGDDISDEAAFRAMKGTGVSVSIGSSAEADYYLRNQGEVLDFLELIAGVSRGDDPRTRARRIEHEPQSGA